MRAFLSFLIFDHTATLTTYAAIVVDSINLLSSERHAEAQSSTRLLDAYSLAQKQHKKYTNINSRSRHHRSLIGMDH